MGFEKIKGGSPWKAIFFNSRQSPWVSHPDPRLNGIALLSGQAVVGDFRFGLSIEPGVFATASPLPTLLIALAA